MPPKKPYMLPEPKNDSQGSSKYEKVKTEKDSQGSIKHENVKTTKLETQKEEDPFDEEFDSFIRSIEDGITELEEKHKKL
jgi:hypothetical protein